MKKIIISLILIFLFVSPSVYAQSEFPVLMYHNVTFDTTLVESDPDVHITPDTLDEHFKYLKLYGYNPISLKEYFSYRQNGTALPENPVIITFDDGYISNYEVAYPLLKKYNYKAVIFVITSRMGDHNVKFPHFSWEEAREMEKSGLVEIESHSHTHPDFSLLNFSQTVLEMRLARYSIETNLNKKCRFFAYPYGKMNFSSSDIAKAAGYNMVFVGRNKNADLQNENLYELPRYTVKGTYSGEDIINMIKK